MSIALTIRHKPGGFMIIFTLYLPLVITAQLM